MSSTRQLFRRMFPPPPWHGPPTPGPFDRSPLPRVSIEWVDSASVNGGLWVDRDEIHPDVMTNHGLKQHTVAFLVDQSDDVYLVAQSIGPDRLGAVLAIPKVSVVAIEGWA